MWTAIKFVALACFALLCPTYASTLATVQMMDDEDGDE
jgi:hypothetical protein